MLYVDGVSSIASIDFRMDEWGVDLAVTGSQKGLMLPSRPRHRLRQRESAGGQQERPLRAGILRLRRPHESKRHRVFSLYAFVAHALWTAGSPSTCCSRSGSPACSRRHQVLADGVRAAVDAWGLRLCAKEPKWYSNTVSAIMVPHGIDGADVIDAAFRRYNLALGAGLSKVSGKLFRIGHLGDLNDLMVLGALAGAEMAMRDVGIALTLGSGVAATQAHFRKTIMAKEKKPTEQERFAQTHPEGVFHP